MNTPFPENHVACFLCGSLLRRDMSANWKGHPAHDACIQSALACRAAGVEPEEGSVPPPGEAAWPRPVPRVGYPAPEKRCHAANAEEGQCVLESSHAGDHRFGAPVPLIKEAPYIMPDGSFSADPKGSVGIRGTMGPDDRGLKGVAGPVDDQQCNATDETGQRCIIPDPYHTCDHRFKVAPSAVYQSPKEPREYHTVVGSDPKGAAGKKKDQLQLIPPVLNTETAKAIACGAAKYGPWNWRSDKVEVMTYIGAMRRHIDAFLNGEDIDESGAHHLGHIAASCAIVLDAALVGNLIDNRPSQKHPQLVSFCDPAFGGADKTVVGSALLKSGQLSDLQFHAVSFQEAVDMINLTAEKAHMPKDPAKRCAHTPQGSINADGLCTVCQERFVLEPKAKPEVCGEQTPPDCLHPHTCKLERGHPGDHDAGLVSWLRASDSSAAPVPAPSEPLRSDHSEDRASAPPVSQGSGLPAPLPPAP